jgi:transcription elongation factor GreA
MYCDKKHGYREKNLMKKEKEVLLTLAGLKKLEDELKVLKSLRRREVAQRIKQAIEFGDLTENSEYEDAKNEQAFIEGRILTLEKMLRNARIIDGESAATGEVGMGSTVVLRDLEHGDEFEYTIVGSVETDPVDKKISNESPVGKAILGKRKGNVVEINVPAGLVKYQIMDVS